MEINVLISSTTGVNFFVDRKLTIDDGFEGFYYAVYLGHIDGICLKNLLIYFYLTKFDSIIHFY